MNHFTAQAWLRPSARLQDVVAGTGDQALSAMSFLNVDDSPESRKFWEDMGYSFLGYVDVALTLEPMTDEQRNARIDALTAKAEQIRSEANKQAAALELEAFGMLLQKGPDHA